jgi:nicotinamidase/pyrazinamidase
MSTTVLTPRPTEEIISALIDLIVDPGDNIAVLKEKLDELRQPGASMAISTLHEKYGMSPFFAACNSGATGTSPKIQYVQLMLLYGAKVNAVGDRKGNTPLHAAALGLRTAICVLLRRSGAHISCVNLERKSPLHLALEHPPSTSIMYFRAITTYKIIEAIVPEDRKEPYADADVGQVMKAIQTGDVTGLDASLKKTPALITTVLSPQVRWTPLHLASALMNVSALKVLCKAPGINVNLVDQDGWSPIHWLFALRIMTPELEPQVQEAFKLLEGASGGSFNYWARVCNSKFIQEKLVGSCFVTEVAPDWKGKSKETKSYTFFVNKQDPSEEYGVDRFQVSMWYDGNPAEEVVGLFEPNNRRALTFRRKGANELVLNEKNRIVFFDERNEVITMESSSSFLDDAQYCWAKARYNPSIDWALRKVPSLLSSVIDPETKGCTFVAGSIEFSVSGVERVSPSSEVYTIEVPGKQGLWMLSVMRTQLELLGSSGFETKLVFKNDGKVVHQCDIATVQKKKDGVVTLFSESYSGPGVLHWAAAEGLANWVKSLLEKKDCNPFDGGADGRSPYLLSLMQYKDADDASVVTKNHVDTLTAELATAPEEEKAHLAELLADAKAKDVAAQDVLKQYRSILDSIKANKRTTEKVLADLKAEYKKGALAKPSMLYALYDLDLPQKIMEEVNTLLGVTNDEAKMYLLHNAAAVGNVRALKRILELTKLTNTLIDQGRKITGGIEYAVAVASKAGKLQVIKYLKSEQCNIEIGQNAAMREAMRSGNTEVASWLLAIQPPATTTTGEISKMPHLPSAAGVPGAVDGVVATIPRVEELQFCSEKELVTTQYLENLLMRSFNWDTAEEPGLAGMARQRGTGTALVLIGMQNDYFEYTGETTGEHSSICPMPGTDKAYVDRLTKFLEACMLKRTAQKVDHIVCVVNWHPENHCSFADAPLHRDALTGGDPRKRQRHCVQNTWGAEIHPAVLEVVGDVAKFTRAGVDTDVDIQSAFFENNQQARTPLHELLEGLGVSRVMIAGMPFETTVQYSVADALYLGYDVVVVEDICRSRNSNMNDRSRLDMNRRGARVVRERSLLKKVKKTAETDEVVSAREEKKDKPMTKSMVDAIRYLLNVPNVRFHIMFEKGLYSENFRTQVDGFDFGNGARTGELFLYLANLVAVKGTKALKKGFTIEYTKFETGDYEALQYPLHYLLMRTKFAPTGLERRAAKSLLIKVIAFINNTPTVPMDANGDPIIRYAGEGMTPKDFASRYPRNPCEKTIDDVLGLNERDGERCKCIFHAPLRAYKPKDETEAKWMKEEVSGWDLWDQSFFKNSVVDTSDAVTKSKIQRPQCPVRLRQHMVPRHPDMKRLTRGDSSMSMQHQHEEVQELQHLLCCTPLQLAVRLNLFEVLEQMICKVERAGLVPRGRRSGKDKTGETFVYEELEDVWQAIPYTRKVDGTLVQSGTPALHYALRAMRQSAIEEIKDLHGALLGCTIGKPGGKKERSMVEFMKTVLKKDAEERKKADMIESASGGGPQEVESEDEDEDETAPMPLQDNPRDIAKGCAPLFMAGTSVPAWNMDEPLDIERYRAVTHDESPLRTSEEERKVVWTVTTDQQWLCPACGCLGAEVVPLDDKEESGNERECIRMLVEYQAALRVCSYLLRSSSLYTRYVERAGEPVQCIRIDIGPNKEKLVGEMYDRAGVFEVSGFGWVQSLQTYQVGDTGLSLILQYAPQLIEQVKALSLFEKCPIDNYDDLNNLVNNSNAAIMIQRRHLWKASRGGVELGVYDKGLSLLHWAALLNDDQLAKLLIAWGANPLTTPLSARLGYSPIHYACYSASMTTLRLIVDNVKEEHSVEKSEQFVNLQALPRVVDEGLLTYNQLYVKLDQALLGDTYPTIRKMCLEDRKCDPSAWPHKTRVDKLTDKATPYSFYGPINTIGETALHVASMFCHTMCIQELVEAYHAETNIRSSLEGFDAHDVAISLQHKATLQGKEDNMLNKHKTTQEQDNEEKDNTTLKGMCQYLNEQEVVLDKLKGFSIGYFWKEAFSYVVFVLTITLYGFLLLDLPQTRGEYWANNVVQSAILGQNFKLDFSTSKFAASAPSPDLGTQLGAAAADCASVGDVITWLKGPFRDVFFTTPDGTNASSPWVIDDKYRLAGSARVAVLRVRNNTACEIPKNYNITDRSECYFRYLPSTALAEDKVITNDNGDVTIIPWARWTWHKQIYDAVQGWVGWQSLVTEMYYPTDAGNYIDFDPDTTENLDAKFNSLDNLAGQDVRMVMVMVNLYSINLDRFVTATVFFEAPMEGGIGLTTRFSTIRLNRYAEATDWFRFFLEIIILIFIVRFANEEVVEMYYMFRTIHTRIKLLAMREKDEAEKEERDEEKKIAMSPKSSESMRSSHRPYASEVQVIDYHRLVRYMKSGFEKHDLDRRQACYMVSEEEKDFDEEQPRMYICPARLRGGDSLSDNMVVQRFMIVVEEVVDHFTQDFNIADTLVLILICICLGYHVVMFSVEERANPSSVFTPGRGFLSEFNEIGYYQDTEQKILSFIVLASWLKSLKHIRFLPNMGPIASAITGTVGSPQIGVFVIVLIVVIMGFVFCCHFAFQKNVEGLRTFRSSFFFVCRTIIGDMDFDSMVQGSLNYGPFIWFMIVCFVVIMLLNILIAVVGNVYDDLIEETEKDWSAAISEKYREDVLGLPSVEKPFGSIFIQQWYRLLGLCIPYYNNIYLKNVFRKVHYKVRKERDADSGVYLYPHIRNWDAVSTTVTERMDEYNQRQNMTNENLMTELENNQTELVKRVNVLENKLSEIHELFTKESASVRADVGKVFISLEKLNMKSAK